MGQDLVAVVEPDAKPAVRKRIEDAALKLDQFFFVYLPLPPERQPGGSFIGSRRGSEL